MERDRRILEELKTCIHMYVLHLFTDHVTNSQTAFWRVLMEGPPDTPYESGVFELFCQFGPEYPVKPPTVRFITFIYHCNINNVGRICHNIFDRGYNAHITMREILNAVYGLILAEEYLTSRSKYDEEAKKHTEKSAGQTLDEMEKVQIIFAA
uniref:UBC core domain-containing protein n=1 Tax=Periophthalmus magnuspinnatus TaxID=409849 RepID=A0A3B4AVB9_9GOBI